jgi:hypothetical protein
MRNAPRSAGLAFAVLAVALLAASTSGAATSANRSVSRSIPITPPEAWPGGRPSSLEPRRTPRALSFTPGEVVVISERGILDAPHGAAPLSRDARMTGLFQSLGLDRARRIGPVPKPGKTRREEVWVLDSNRPGFDPVAASRALQAQGGILAASPNYKFSVLSTIPDDLYLIYQ